jgi:hypothetical protein
MASGGRIVFVFDDIIQRPLGTYGHMGFPEVFRGYLLGLGGLPKRPGYVAIELSSWKLSGERPGKGSGKGSTRQRSEHEGKHSQTGKPWRTMVVQYPLLVQLSLSHPSHTPR